MTILKRTDKLNDKVDALNDRLTNLEISSNERFSQLEINTAKSTIKIEFRIDMLEHKLGVHSPNGHPTMFEKSEKSEYSE
jgi:hypothetical protein